MLEPCPGCGALFAPFDGPTHRYIGASAACWALAACLGVGEQPPAGVLADSRVPDSATTHSYPAHGTGTDVLVLDAYAVQHHGEDSSQAIQSVALHLLTVHGVLARAVKPAGALWIRRRALRIRNVFHKLEPPSLGLALTLRHLFPGGGVTTPSTREDYVASVYDAWMLLHRATIEEWYDRYVVPG